MEHTLDNMQTLQKTSIINTEIKTTHKGQQQCNRCNRKRDKTQHENPDKFNNNETQKKNRQRRGTKSTESGEDGTVLSETKQQKKRFELNMN